ncbi:MAG: pyridoxamine 5'-phosphate oxidase family protein [Actinobacteria bacterium]|nr:pyridoxamine 5'-phosphate oxidase family protein [Actinomycetota bacterium]
MSRRSQVQMTDEEVAAFLDGNRTVHLATNGPDGFPHLTTLWYGCVDGRIAVWTYRKSQKVRNLERDPRITALVEAGEQYAALRGVMIRGKARMSTERDDVMAAAEAVYQRNGDRFGDVQFQGLEIDRGTRDALELMSTKRIAIVVEPDEIVSWDHRKLGGVY